MRKVLFRGVAHLYEEVRKVLTREVALLLRGRTLPERGDGFGSRTLPWIQSLESMILIMETTPTLLKGQGTAFWRNAFDGASIMLVLLSSFELSFSITVAPKRGKVMLDRRRDYLAL